MKIIVITFLLSISPQASCVFTESSTKQRLGALIRRDDCQTNPAWQATQNAWTVDDTDKNAASWWTNISSGTHTSFANELGKDFGGHLNSFGCGINDYSTCSAPPCSDYLTSSPAWSYQLILSVVNLNTFFNDLYTGIENGQQDYLGLTKDLAQTFYTWKNPSFILGDAAFWIVAIITALLAIPAAAIDGPEIAIAMAGVGAFVGAGVQQVTFTLQPDPILSQMTISQGEASLDKFATTVGQATRAGIASWANTTFSGLPDPNNQTILTYLSNGSFSSPSILPTVTQIEAFYKSQMVARKINAQWLTQKIYIQFHLTSDPNDTSGPNITRYYSEADGGVYYLYHYDETGVLKGQLNKPFGLDYLNTTSYGITPSDITKSSARAFRTAGFNYTNKIAQSRIISSLSSNGSLTPFQDGAGWEGTWTLPVCDTGSLDFDSQYLNHSSRYGSLPCCCGTNCSDTAAFVEAANLKGFQTLLRGCKEQLKGTGVDFEGVDYGFKWEKSFVLWMASVKMGVKVGVCIGMVAGSLVVACFCGVCMALCCS